MQLPCPPPPAGVADRTSGPRPTFLHRSQGTPQKNILWGGKCPILWFHFVIYSEYVMKNRRQVWTYLFNAAFSSEMSLTVFSFEHCHFRANLPWSPESDRGHSTCCPVITSTVESPFLAQGTDLPVQIWALWSWEHSRHPSVFYIASVLSQRSMQPQFPKGKGKA